MTSGPVSGTHSLPMARVSIEDCLNQVENRFALVQLSAQRSRQLTQGSTPVVKSKNKLIITALREIAAGKVGFEVEFNEKEAKIFQE